MTEQPRSIARRARDMIRLLLQVLAALVLGACGWTAWIFYTAKVQHDAVAAVEKAGGSVTYDWELRDGPVLPTPKPPWLKWLVDTFGADCFSTVATVNLRGKASDALLAEVGKLVYIESLDARGSSITDAGLARLSRLTSLQKLDLGRTAITDAGLAHLRPLTNLTILSLDNNSITDDGILSLKALGGLQWLNLSETRMSKMRAEELERTVRSNKTFR
jgi:hypothetical protein